MKPIKPLVRFFTALPFICLLFPLNAQIYCDLSTQGTHMAAVENIQYCYGPSIGIDNDQLIDFLSWRRSESYDPSLNFPLANITEGFDVNVFEVNWASVENALRYEVKSLNLRTGEIATYSSEDEVFSTVETDHMAYYLYVFSTVSTEGLQTVRSADYIIIDEKPVLHLIDTDPSCSCNIPLLSAYWREKESSAAIPSPNSLRVFPNPSNGESQLEYTLSSNQEVSIWLSDLLGRSQKVFLPPTLQSAGTQHLTLDLSEYSQGWYQVHLQTKNDYQSQRILKLE